MVGGEVVDHGRVKVGQEIGHLPDRDGSDGPTAFAEYGKVPHSSGVHTGQYAVNRLVDSGNRRIGGHKVRNGEVEILLCKQNPGQEVALSENARELPSLQNEEAAGLSLAHALNRGPHVLALLDLDRFKIPDVGHRFVFQYCMQFHGSPRGDGRAGDGAA